MRAFSSFSRTSGDLPRRLYQWYRGSSLRLWMRIVSAIDRASCTHPWAVFRPVLPRSHRGATVLAPRGIGPCRLAVRSSRPCSPPRIQSLTRPSPLGRFPQGWAGRDPGDLSLPDCHFARSLRTLWQNNWQSFKRVYEHNNSPE